MKVNSIRRVTNDHRHNAFTGACWFKEDLYVGYRQADDHDGPDGRVIIVRSRDEGVTWDTVAVLRGDAVTRDAALHTDGERLYATSIIHYGDERDGSGVSFTTDGDHWSAFQPVSGADGYVLWRPVFFKGRNYCAGYDRNRETGFGVHWFESDDAMGWTRKGEVHVSDKDHPNECFLEILPDGSATMLMRCEKSPKHPYLCRSQYPFESWKMERLTDILLTGPALWTADDKTYIGGRWHPDGPKQFDEGGYSAHTAIFRVHEGKTAMQCVLPSGPHPDHSYMGVARRPDDPRRFSISFYGNAIAPADPALDPWLSPDVFVADVVCGNI